MSDHMKKIMEKASNKIVSKYRNRIIRDVLIISLFVFIVIIVFR